MSFGVFGPAAPPSAANTAALQQRMVQLGYSVSPGGVYGDAEDVVVRSYGAQLGIDDYSELNDVIAQVLPVMAADVEVKGTWQPPPSGTLTAGATSITGATGAVPSWAWFLGLGAVAWLLFDRH